MGYLVKATAQSFDPLRRNTVPILQEAGWAPGQFWTGAKKFAPIVSRFQDRPGASDWLHQSSAEVKNSGNQTSSSLCVFVTGM
jgi:hypothetical protein